MLTSHKRSNSTTSCDRPPTKKKKKKKMRYPGYLAHVVSGMFYSVVDNRRQPNLYIYIIGGRQRGLRLVSIAKTTGRLHLCCTTLPTEHKEEKSRRKETGNPSAPVLFLVRHFVFLPYIAPTVAMRPKIGRVGMSSSVHSRERAKATGFSVPSFEADLVR